MKPAWVPLSATPHVHKIHIFIYIHTYICCIQYKEGASYIKDKRLACKTCISDMKQEISHIQFMCETPHCKGASSVCLRGQGRALTALTQRP